MKSLSVFLTFCTLLSLSRANHLFNGSKDDGLCEHVREHSQDSHIGEFVPQCNDDGNFLPQQCSGSTGYCWCVNVFTGEEIPDTKTPPGSTPVDCDDEFYCPKGWTRFGKQCFIFIDSEKTWPEAESYCLFEDANLASIHSAEENHFVQALTRGDSHEFPETWIGGFDAIPDAFWMWSDGSKFNYENWAEEDEKEENEHCLKMNYEEDLKWEPESCNDTLPFVCAKRI
ncbi:galactose-specific lectin nattectin-like [Micropterus dolomieu]|uniref:galactose-specific lectin nattectin-like n=1 Tax=Micropterus dolomieu TaxID=147949 RepID=UPI001E8D4344|nr:galactose-specific lectin nattectin-like [Micropterus dolomieu]